MRKDRIMSLSLDASSAVLLGTLAEKQTEGNRSLLVRQWIRQAAGVDGLAEYAEAQQQVKHEHREAVTA